MPLPPGPPRRAARPLRVVAWPDPALHHGFDLQHPYVELVWTPVLGPTAVLAARRLDLLLRRRPDGVDVDVPDLGAQLGVGTRSTGGRWSPIVRALERLERFGFARWDPHADRFHLRNTVPAVPHYVLSRLPATVVHAHDDLLEAHLRHATGRGSTPRRGAPDPARPPTLPPSSPPDAETRLRALPVGRPPGRGRDR